MLPQWHADNCTTEVVFTSSIIFFRKRYFNSSRQGQKRFKLVGKLHRKGVAQAIIPGIGICFLLSSKYSSRSIDFIERTRACNLFLHFIFDKIISRQIENEQRISSKNLKTTTTPTNCARVVLRWRCHTNDIFHLHRDIVKTNNER